MAKRSVHGQVHSIAGKDKRTVRVACGKDFFEPSKAADCSLNASNARLGTNGPNWKVVAEWSHDSMGLPFSRGFTDNYLARDRSPLSTPVCPLSGPVHFAQGGLPWCRRPIELMTVN